VCAPMGAASTGAGEFCRELVPPSRRPAPVEATDFCNRATAMLTGRLKRGMRLPATRDFAGQHGISRRVVVNVFEQLRTEGYLVSRVGSGTCVSDQLPEDLFAA
jgi:GntR family transcriptional regulator / MocR family aminotransferase